MKLLILFLSLFICAVTGFAQPKFESVDGNNINTGNHIKGQPVTYEVKFKNSGDADLAIKSVSTSCGCSTALTSNNSVKPGEAGSINFTFNGQYTGQISKSIYITTNEAEASHTVTMTMTMVDPLSVNPNSIISEGKVGDEINQIATITNSLDKDVTISEVSSNSPVVKVTNDKTVLKTGEAASVNITIKIFEDSPVNAAVVIKTSEGDYQIPIFVDIKKQ